MRILVTGGLGFIGARLAKALCPEHELLIFDNVHPQVHGFGPLAVAEELAKSCKIVKGHVEDAASLGSVVRYFDPHIVYHLAAETGTGQSYDEPTRYNLANVIGTTNLLESMRTHGKSARRLVLSSSRAIYGEGAGRDEQGQVRLALPRNDSDMKAGDFDLKDIAGRRLTPVPMTEDLAPAPASVYASTKLMQEYLCQQCLVGTGIELTILRLQNVYGPGQSLRNPYTGVISIFAELIAGGGSPEVFEDGEIVRDFVYVDDVVEAFRICAASERSPEGPINIGTGELTTIREMARALLTLYGRDPGDHKVTGKFRPGDVRHAVADIGAAREKLGWTPKYSFGEGLAKFVAWARQSH